MKQKLIPNVKKETLLTECEKLMVRGIESPTEISRKLEISFNTAKNYILIIKNRWIDSIGAKKLETERQELIQRTKEVLKESWELKDNSRNTMQAIGAIRTALMAIERLQKLQGIDNLPPQPEKPMETQIFEYAQEINSLPDQKRRIALKMIRDAIARKKKEAERKRL